MPYEAPLPYLDFVLLAVVAQPAGLEQPQGVLTKGQVMDCVKAEMKLPELFKLNHERGISFVLSDEHLLALRTAGANVSTGQKGNQFRQFRGSHSAEEVAFGHTNVPAGAQVNRSTLQARQDSTDHQGKQLPSGGPIRRGNIETQRTRWLSRVNLVTGSWSLAAYPRSYRPVSPSEKPPAISPHSVGWRTRRNRRLGDFPQMMIKPQEEPSRVNLCATWED